MFGNCSHAVLVSFLIPIVFNTYRGWPVLVMRGMSDYILSKEGVTQGDPLSTL